MKLSLKISTFFMAVSGALMAQHTNHNELLWLHYLGRAKVAPKWSLGFEGSFRLANAIDQKQQYFVRPFVDYQATKALTLSAGFSYYDTYVYGEKPLVKITSPEEHYWLQGNYNHPFEGLNVGHRWRQEFRFVGLAKLNEKSELSIQDYAYRARMRYMLTLSYPLWKENNFTKLSALLADEVFLNVSANSGATLLNQNRVIMGFAYSLSPHHQWQLAYVHQNIWNFGNTIQESNPAIRLSYVSHIDFTK